MEEEIINALSIFYKLKREYDNDKNKKKQKIIKNEELSKDEKHDLYSNLKFKCVNCKRNVNTIFETHSDRLVCLCGANSDSIPEDPCPLNIKIIKGIPISLEKHTSDLKNKREELMNIIMKIKYDILFNLVNEDVSLEKFQEKKEDYTKITSLLNTYQSKLIDITESLDKKDKLRMFSLQLDELINEIKNNVKESLITSNSQLLRDSVEIYINNLLDIVSKTNDIKYSHRTIEKYPDNTYHYVEKKYTIDELEILNEKKYKIESLILGKKK